MRIAHVRAVVRREWIELRRNRLVVLTMAILPVALVGAALATTRFLSGMPDSEFRGDVPTGLAPQLQALGRGRDALLALVADQYLYMLLLIALALPSTIAAHAIVGEKVERTLEPLLATPISTSDLLLGKCLAAVIPATLITQLSYGITLAGFALTCPPAVLSLALRPVWPLAFGAVAPGLALLSALAAIVASSRVNDPRTAQGLVGFLVIPVIVMGISSVMGELFLDVRLLAWGAAGVLVVDAIALWIAVRLFSREAILTRWK
ncbi:MAG: ABC transporter permease [Myxococcota bacterium]|nr:ABC transporter permease [Myxococcota bacterium]